MSSKFVSSDAQQHIEILRNDYFGSLYVTIWPETRGLTLGRGNGELREDGVTVACRSAARAGATGLR